MLPCVIRDKDAAGIFIRSKFILMQLNGTGDTDMVSQVEPFT